jgi:AbrB family looped-hinge helix DNA binding protein
MPRPSPISSKGQITVPVQVRRRLGLKEGDRVEFAFVEGNAVLRPVRSADNPFSKYVGALAKRTPGGAAVAWVRKMRDDDRPR